MIRFTLREFRTRAVVALVVLLVAAVVLAITGANIVNLYNTTVANCQASNDCATATSAFLGTDNQLQSVLNDLIVLVPAVLGIFWGAPLIARELEAGTHRLAWTQSVTRTRWLATKVGVVGVCALLVTGLLSLMVTWWFSPIDRVTSNVFGSFDQRDVVPIAYAAFAFALGATSGALLRRTIPAMGTTFVVFVAVRLAVVDWVRPNFMAPLRRTVPDSVFRSLPTGGLHASITAAQLTAAQSGGLPVNAWLISGQTLNAAGHVIGQNGLLAGAINFTPDAGGFGLTIQGAGTCPDVSPTPPINPGPMIQKCVEQLHLREVLTFQPASRYGPFQWFELAIFLALALALVGLCFWWIRRRAT
jgi:hypothetical protein